MMQHTNHSKISIAGAPGRQGSFVVLPRQARNAGWSR